MDSETIRILSELGVSALALIIVTIFAYTVFNRSKTDTSVIKVFADLVSNSIKDMSEGLSTHGNESTARHGEIVLALQAMNTSLAMLVDGGNEILLTVKEVRKTGGKIMETVTPIDKMLQEIRDELQQLRVSIDAHLISSTQFRDNITKQAGTIEVRLLDVEKRVTQETPKPQDIENETRPNEE